MNITVPYDHPIFHSYPFYHSQANSLIPGISDPLLAIILPILAYWLASALFYCLDVSNWAWLDRYRIYDSIEISSRNRATPSEVFRAVIVQQVIQTALGYLWLSEVTESPDHPAAMRAVARALSSLGVLLFSHSDKQAYPLGLFKDASPWLAYFLYWYLIPTAQLVVAMVVFDTCQYFFHRAMHISKFLYKHFHSMHHRLYVPYAFGALYNHPLDGFLDSFGLALSEAAAGLSVRQATLFFTLSACKNVDDHCGYSLPFDPLQMLSGNTADYHDIHHQIIGIKSNLSPGSSIGTSSSGRA